MALVNCVEEIVRFNSTITESKEAHTRSDSGDSLFTNSYGMNAPQSIHCVVCPSATTASVFVFSS